MENKDNVFDRLASPTPTFFNRLAAAGLIIATAGASILASGALLPAGLVAIGGYLVTGGSILTAVSKLTTKGE